MFTSLEESTVIIDGSRYNVNEPKTNSKINKQSRREILMRVPETFYFDHGYIKFFKEQGIIKYQIFKFSQDGLSSGTIEVGTLGDESHLKELQTLGNVTT